MNRYESFMAVCAGSSILTKDQLEEVAYALSELEDSFGTMTRFMDSLERGIAGVEKKPVECWSAATRILAWLDHWDYHAKALRRLLEEVRRPLDSLPGVRRILEGIDHIAVDED